jgi:hypothetical protein
LNTLVAFAPDPATILARILAEKGTLSSTDLATAGQKVNTVVFLLADKGLLTTGDQTGPHRT